MEFGPTLDNPLLQLAVSTNETVILRACGAPRDLDVHVEMEESPERRDAIRVFLDSPCDTAEFTMLLRKYFDRFALWRVARYAWGHRIPRQTQRARLYVPAEAAPILN